MTNPIQGEMFARFSKERVAEVDEQVEEFYKRYDYDIREFPIEVVYRKFTEKDEEDVTEWFIPSYQRRHVWKEKQQSEFIESLFLNLPIPYLYVSDTGEEGLVEIIDGSQRVRTIARFLSNELELSKLSTLTSLNGFRFKDLSRPTQRRFMRKTLRTIELLSMNEQSRRELFNRLNTGGTQLTDSEKRYGVRDGRFFELVKELAKEPLLHHLCPISEGKVARREYDEFVLRFFAYANDRQSFSHSVDEFLDSYLDRMNASDFDAGEYRDQFHRMLLFVRDNFQHGFKKHAKNMSVPRIRFEAISVGTAEALREKTDLRVKSADWAYDPESEFVELTTSDASNSRPKVNARIEFVKQALLNG